MLIKLGWRNLWRNKLRTGIMLAAMVFGLVSVIGVMGFINGMIDSMVNNAIAWQTSHIQVHNKRYIDNPQIKDTLVNSEELLKAIQTHPEVTDYAARFLADGMVASARSTRGVRINGIELAQEARVTPLATHIIDGQWLDESGRNPALVSQKTAQRLRLKVGSKVVLTFSDLQGEVAGAAFRVKGIFKTPSSAFDDGNLFVRKADLQALAGMRGIHEIAILTAKDADLAKVSAELQQATQAENQVRTWREVQPLLASLLSQMGVSNGIMLGVFVLALAFGIVNIMLMSVFERTREFGVLMAVGMQKHKIRNLIIFETALLGFTGSALGIIGAILLISLLQHTGLPLGALAEGLGGFGIDTTVYPRVGVGNYLATLVTVVGASMLAALYPARQILKRRPVDAMADKH
ncbi:ABC transporter permease [Paraferrimonas sedimenticola]|uniref:ABC transporter permease n=1 Tax=Paraferrimonas sedimenticola TaxID=375674 RepID=A0AA37W0T5_9GAMM|nr:FtsX-like permease family protein [Paraferrimonas sedimenticola]GLP95968.1 ABC transporter permease [Paraferrimonas sedimenticola]